MLEGVYGHPVPLEGGAFVNADERYIRDSILLPQSQVVAGYKPVMPTFQGHISEDELLKVIAYIKALGKNERVDQ
jgi:cytochrome c oxidase subunit 2